MKTRPNPYTPVEEQHQLDELDWNSQPMVVRALQIMILVIAFGGFLFWLSPSLAALCGIESSSYDIFVKTAYICGAIGLLAQFLKR